MQMWRDVMIDGFRNSEGKIVTRLNLDYLPPHYDFTFEEDDNHVVDKAFDLLATEFGTPKFTCRQRGEVVEIELLEDCETSEFITGDDGLIADIKPITYPMGIYPFTFSDAQAAKTAVDMFNKYGELAAISQAEYEAEQQAARKNLFSTKSDQTVEDKLLDDVVPF